MDFIRILRSLEELLYEVITWIVFYPRTFWRTATAPLRMLRYARGELTDAPEQQYTDTLSPVLFLMISLWASHALSEAIAPSGTGSQGLMGRLMTSEQNQLITRSVAFAIFPLVYAAQELRRAGRSLDRETLRAPFYGQCFITAVFALGLGVAVSLMRMHHLVLLLAGSTLAAAAIVWYLVVQARWLRERTPMAPAMALSLAAFGFVKASAIIVLAAAVLSQVP